jgi:signal transduction histidine kinase
LIQVRRLRALSWLRSLQGQVMVAIAVALMIAQGVSAWLLWHEVRERHIAQLVNSAAIRMMGDRALMPRPDGRPSALDGPPPPDGGPDASRDSRSRRHMPPLPPVGPDDRLRLPRLLHVHVDAASPEQAGDRHLVDVETALREALTAQGNTPGTVIVVVRNATRDPLLEPYLPALKMRFRVTGDGSGQIPDLVVASVRQADGTWLTVRSFLPSSEAQLLFTLLRQTILIYLVLIVAVGVILRRITRPLRALTGRLESFAADPGVTNQIPPQGPEDIQRVIIAHNAMEARISALLDEKDVMLGAIGHDLKTPLAALRVRIEAVEDDYERGRMAATIEDINRSLDDILSLARVGRPSDPIESTELSALVTDIINEYEDMGDDVVLTDAQRIVAPLRATWLRRALRNLVSNALRYGVRARVGLSRDGNEAVLTVEDDGPGIPEGDIARMMEPFTRLDPSRNSATGGTGLGLTLARAIADQHGGSLMLANRLDRARIVGLVATLRLPVA